MMQKCRFIHSSITLQSVLSLESRACVPENAVKYHVFYVGNNL